MMNESGILSFEVFYFKLVYEQKGIHAAARSINQDPAHISRMIKKLEITLNAKLFVRHKTGLTPTEAADLYYLAVAGAQAEFVKILNGQERSARRIRIGFSSTIAYAHFSAQMTQELLNLNLLPEFIFASSTEVLEKMKSRDLDFSIVPSQIKFPGLISRKVTSESLVLCAGSGKVQDILLIHPEMLGLEKMVHSIAYKKRWMVKDYFVLAKLLCHNDQLMGLLPESLVSEQIHLKIITRFDSAGKITALSWPGSVGMGLLKAIK